MIKIYGSFVSRATRNLWMLEELGLDYEHVDLNWAKKENRSPSYLKINSTGKVPTLTDGDATLSESIAINLYLAQKHGGGSLWPDDEPRRARCVQWTVWAAGELEPVAYPMVREFVFKKENDRDDALITDMSERAAPLMNVMVEALEGSEYLTGADFTVADLNVASVMEYMERSQFDLSGWPLVDAWYRNTYGRPANQAVQSARAPAAAEMLRRMGP